MTLGGQAWMENEVKTGSPEKGWPSPFVQSLGRSCIQSSLIPIAAYAWACSASHPATSRDAGDWNGLHLAKRVREGLGTGTPQAAREHSLPWEWALTSYQPWGLKQWPLPAHQPSSLF